MKIIDEESEQLIKQIESDIQLYGIIRVYSDIFTKGVKFAEKEVYNQAVNDCAESATASIYQETVNGGKVARIDKKSILKNLKP